MAIGAMVQQALAFSISRSSSLHAPPLLLELAAVSQRWAGCQLEFLSCSPQARLAGTHQARSLLGVTMCAAGHRGPGRARRTGLIAVAQLTAMAQARARSLAHLQELSCMQVQLEGTRIQTFSSVRQSTGELGRTCSFSTITAGDPALSWCLRLPGFLRWRCKGQSEFVGRVPGLPFAAGCAQAALLLKSRSRLFLITQRLPRAQMLTGH